MRFQPWEKPMHTVQTGDVGSEMNRPQARKIADRFILDCHAKAEQMTGKEVSTYSPETINTIRSRLTYALMHGLTVSELIELLAESEKC